MPRASAARDRGRRARLRIERVAAVDEQLDALRAVSGAEPRVIRRALVTELRNGRQRTMVGEATIVGEDRRQHARGLFGFDRAMERARQISRREMHAMIAGVGGG